MTTNSFIDLLDGFVYNGENKGELTFVGNGEPPHPQLLSDDKKHHPKNPWVTAVEYHLRSIIPPNVLHKMHSVSSSINDRNLWKLQGPIKVPGTANKYLIYFQFLSWSNTFNVNNHQEEVVVGQVSIVFDKFNGIIKEYSQPPYSKYQIPVPQRSYSNYLTESKVNGVHSLLNKDKSFWKNKYFNHECRGALRLACMIEKQVELDFRPEELVDYMVHTNLQTLSEKNDLYLIGINKVSVYYPNHRLGCSKLPASYGEMSYPLSENSPDQLANYITNIVNVLADDQVYLYNRWKNGCFKLNLEGMPQITYDQSNYQFNVSKPTGELFTRPNPTTNELATLSKYVFDQLKQSQ